MVSTALIHAIGVASCGTSIKNLAAMSDSFQWRMRRGLLPEHRTQPDDELVRGVFGSVRIHLATADVHVVGEQELMFDPGAVLDAQLGHVVRPDLAAEPRARTPCERDARIPMLRRVRGAVRRP